MVSYEIDPRSLKLPDYTALRTAYGHAIGQIPNPYFENRILENEVLLKAYNKLTKLIHESKTVDPVTFPRTW